MNNYIDVIKKILELSDTIGEAVYYMQDNLEAKEDGVIDIVIDDTINSMESISKALEPIANTLQDEKIQHLTCSLNKNLNLLDKAFYKDLPGKAIEIMDMQVIPAYNQWKIEIENVLRRFTYS